MEKFLVCIACEMINSGGAKKTEFSATAENAVFSLLLFGDNGEEDQIFSTFVHEGMGAAFGAVVALTGGKDLFLPF